VLLIKEKDESKNHIKEYKADEVAKMMLQKIKTNINEPNFWNKREKILQETNDEFLKK
jgi:hypothetical protein